MKRTLVTIILGIVLVIVGVILGGNVAMTQMSAMTGDDYSAVLAMDLNGEKSQMWLMGTAYHFDGSTIENGEAWMKLAIQRGVDKVQYIAEQMVAMSHRW